MSRRLTQVISICLVLLTSALPLLAQATGNAILYPAGKGNVTLNGKPVFYSVAVKPGDKIVTGPGSSANLTGSGWNVQVQPDSTITYSGNNAVKVGDLTFTPKSQPFALQVTNSNGTLTVTVTSGSASIEGPDVAAGTTLAAGEPPMSAGAAPVTPVGTEAQVATAGVGRRTATKLIIIGATGAAAAATVVAMRSEGSVSPSK